MGGLYDLKICKPLIKVNFITSFSKSYELKTYRSYKCLSVSVTNFKIFVFCSDLEIACQQHILVHYLQLAVLSTKELEYVAFQSVDISINSILTEL